MLINSFRKSAVTFLRFLNLHQGDPVVLEVQAGHQVLKTVR